MYLFSEISLEKMPSVGFIPMTSSVIDEFVGDMMKDLPILKRYRVNEVPDLVPLTLKY